MSNGNAKQPQLPKTANMPPPKASPDAMRGHNSFLAPMHEDVGRVMQNIIDLQAEVAMLRKQNMEWERRALLAEGKADELRQEIADLKDDFSRDMAVLKAHSIDDIARVQRELDYYKSRDSIVQTKLHIGAQHFLDCISAVERDRKDHELKVLEGVESEMSKLLAEEPMPRVVSAGPATGGDVGK